jgi:hypothetical protein
MTLVALGAGGNHLDSEVELLVIVAAVAEGGVVVV